MLRRQQVDVSVPFHACAVFGNVVSLHCTTMTMVSPVDHMDHSTFPLRPDVLLYKVLSGFFFACVAKETCGGKEKSGQ